MTNARWQRWLVAWHGVLVLVWLQGFWQRSVPLALAGLVAVPLLSRLTMLPQFLLMAWVCRHDAAPPLGPARLLRAWWAESRWAALVFGWWQPFRMHAVPDWLPPRAADRPAPRGVVLVHGFLCNRAFWTPWFAPLRARGHAFVAVTLEPAFGSIDDYAPAIEAAVRRVTEATGQAPLIVGHSMGGLVCRSWLARYGGQGIRRLITLATPNGGTHLARYGWGQNSREMQVDSHWLRDLAHEQPSIPVIALENPLDNFIMPRAGQRLPQAQNLTTHPVGHLSALSDRRIADQLNSLCRE